MTIQTRSEETGLKQHNSIKEAFEHTFNDPTVWKVSFQVGEERVRLVSNGDGTWIYQELIRRPLVNSEIEFDERSEE